MAYSTTTLPIEQGKIYHIYTHAVGDERIFSTPYQCERFLSDIEKRIPKAADVYAWCLMNNHFHFLLKVTADPKDFSNALGEALNAYAKWYNNRNERMGSLFVRPYKRKVAEDIDYIKWLMRYIHCNITHHKISPNWQHYPWSSFLNYIGKTDAHDFLDMTYLLKLFGNLEAMLAFHERPTANFLEDEMI